MVELTVPTAPQALYGDKGPKKDLGNRDEGHDYIDSIPNDPDLFSPVAESMRGPTKEYADKAASLTKHMYDLYKSGDPDVQATVRNWEKANKTLPGDRSGATMSESAMWEAYMTHYGNLMTDAAEREDISPEEKAELLKRGRFDRGSPGLSMNMQKINSKLSARY